MALDRQLGAAFIDGQRRFGHGHRVICRRLRPFCAWHILLLQAVDSPFLRQGEVALEDLKRAVSICGRRYGDSHLSLPWWPIALREEALYREVRKFLSYIGDCLQRPDYAVAPPPAAKADSGRHGPQVTSPPKRLTSAPDVLVLVSDVAGWIKCGPTELPLIWEMALGQAYWYQAMALRAQGASLDFLDEDEREFQREMTAAKNAKRDS